MESKQCCIYLLENWSFANENKSIEKKECAFCKQKQRIANKNEELQNINETEQKQWFCNTYFPWPYLLIYLQRCFYFAFQSSLSLRYSFPLCASRFCVSHLVKLFWHGGGVKGRGCVQKAWACLPGSDIICSRRRSQLMIRALSLSRGMRVDRFL